MAWRVRRGQGGGDPLIQDAAGCSTNVARSPPQIDADHHQPQRLQPPDQAEKARAQDRCHRRRDKAAARRCGSSAARRSGRYRWHRTSAPESAGRLVLSASARKPRSKDSAKTSAIMRQHGEDIHHACATSRCRRWRKAAAANSRQLDHGMDPVGQGVARFPRAVQHRQAHADGEIRQARAARHCER